MPKIFISVHPFGAIDPTPFNILKEANIDYKINTLKRKLKPEETMINSTNCDGIIAGTEDLTPLIMNSKNLKIISRVGIGLDSVPLDLCKQKNIIVRNTPDAMTKAVVELTLGVMINITRFIHQADALIKKGVWERFVGKRLEKSIIGIIGAGRIGESLIKLLLNFQPKKILLNDILDKSNFIKRNQINFKGEIKQTTKEEIYQSSDIISLHTPLTFDTKKMINEKTLSLFKKDSFLINQARGALIDEEALYQHLNKKKIKGAALDVFENEPYHGKFTRLNNILLTSHMGSCSIDCRIQMETQATLNIIQGLNIK